MDTLFKLFRPDPSSAPERSLPPHLILLSHSYSDSDQWNQNYRLPVLERRNTRKMARPREVGCNNADSHYLLDTSTPLHPSHPSHSFTSSRRYGSFSSIGMILVRGSQHLDKLHKEKLCTASSARECHHNADFHDQFSMPHLPHQTCQHSPFEPRATLFSFLKAEFRGSHIRE